MKSTVKSIASKARNHGRINADFRSMMVVSLIASGYPYRRNALQTAQNATKVQHRHLKKWFLDTDFYCEDNLIEKYIMDLKTLIETELEYVFEDFHKKRDAATYRELGTVGGILMDKYMNLSGMPNATISIVDWRKVVEDARKENEKLITKNTEDD